MVGCLPSITKVGGSNLSTAKVCLKKIWQLLTARFEFGRQVTIQLFKDSSLVKMAFKLVGKSVIWTI